MGNTNNIKKRCIEKALKRWENFPPTNIKAQMVHRHADRLLKRYLSFYSYIKTKRVALGYE